MNYQNTFNKFDSITVKYQNYFTEFNNIKVIYQYSIEFYESEIPKKHSKILLKQISKYILIYNLNLLKWNTKILQELWGSLVP